MFYKNILNSQIKYVSGANIFDLTVEYVFSPTLARNLNLK